MSIKKQSKKGIPGWEKIFANHLSDKWLTYRIYRGLLKLNNKKPIQSRERTWIDISPKKIHNVHKHRRTCSASLITREIQITTLVWHLSNPLETENGNSWYRCGEIGTFVHCWLKYKMVRTIWKTVRQFLQKLKTELSDDQQLHFWGYAHKNGKQGLRIYLYTQVHRSFTHNS